MENIMKIQLILLSSLALTVSACESFYPDRSIHTTSSVPPRNYNQTLTSTDIAGTKTVEKTSNKIRVDSDGHKRTTYKSKTTTDPKGLMNKTTLSKTTDIKEEEDGKITNTHKYEENERMN